MDITNFLIAVTGLVAGVGAFIKLLSELRTIHTIVNSQKAEMQKEIDCLRMLLDNSIKANVAIDPVAAASVPAAQTVTDRKAGA
jgi:hypothetical protein